MKFIKILCLASIILTNCIPVPAQELAIGYSSGMASFMTFSQWKGFSAEWNHNLKSGTRLTLGFNYALKTKEYDWIHKTIPTEISESKIYIEKRTPHNERFASIAMIGFCPLDNPKAAIFWGPSISLNWMKIHEKTQRFANQWFQDAEYYSLDWIKHRFGLGLFVEFEIRKFIFKRMSTSIRLHSDVSGYDGIGSWDRSVPGTIVWTGADIGLRWNFSKRMDSAGNKEESLSFCQPLPRHQYPDHHN